MLGDRSEEVERYTRPLSDAVELVLLALPAWFVWTRLAWQNTELLTQNHVLVAAWFCFDLAAVAALSVVLRR